MIGIPTSLWLYLLTLFGAIQLVHGLPWQQYSVELKTCDSGGDNAIPLVQECALLCEPVRVAQETCEQGLPCTCSAAPPAQVKACFECHLSTSEDASSFSSLTRHIETYAELCGETLLTLQSSAPHDASHPRSNETESSSPLHRRERDHTPCVYGVPSLRVSAPTIHPIILQLTDRKIILFIVFAFALVVCTLERRGNKS